jgi:carboxylesterase
VIDLIHPLAAPFRLEGTNGEAMVLIHGFTGSPAHWRLLAPALNQAGYTVTAPLLPGHGTSIDDMAAHTGEDWLTASVKAALEVGDHRRLHLIGLSLGGLISILIARPTGAASVTTINAPVRFRDPTIYLAPLLHPLRPRVERRNTDPPSLDDEARPLWITYAGFPTRRAVDLLAISRRALREAKRLRRPALVIQSRTDETVRPSSGRILKRALGPHAEMVWLERSLHNALLDGARDQVRDAILRRLQTA